MYESTVQLIEQINNKLPMQLGENYSIKPQYLDIINRRKNIEMRPDFEIINKKTQTKVIVEVKGSTLNDDLPLAILPLMNKFKYANKKPRVKFVLISVSKISKLLKDELEKEGFSIIEQSKNEDVINKLVDIIKEPINR